jgi:hypothetical protein
MAGLIVAAGSSFCLACSRCARPSCYQARPVRPAPIIFNPAPSRYDAGQFAYRSDWPSADSYYQGGQFVYYREYVNDYQGRNLSPNWTHRQFQTYRTGFGYR